ncbi:MAG: fasciclin domain-containing protein [Deltaproteobacteria bacterium]
MQDIYSTVKTDKGLRKLLHYLETAGLAATLQSGGPFTLFAPDDDAFNRMDIEKDLVELAKLKETMNYHLVSGRYRADEIREMEDLVTESGKSLTVALDEGQTVVDNGKFVRTDIECSNGLIHVIDNVFQPHISGWYREE